MKTAMQELIEDLQKEFSTQWGHLLKVEAFKPFLEKEKEQIINAYENGYEACDMDEAMEVNKKLTSGDLYYNMNYNQNK